MENRPIPEEDDIKTIGVDKLKIKVENETEDDPLTLDKIKEIHEQRTLEQKINSMNTEELRNFVLHLNNIIGNRAKNLSIDVGGIITYSWGSYLFVDGRKIGYIASNQSPIEIKRVGTLGNLLVFNIKSLQFELDNDICVDGYNIKLRKIEK